MLKKLIPLLLTLTLCSAGVKNMFVQRKGEFGWVFHVFSQKMPSADKKCPDLQYDYTYTQKNDSVTMLTTLILPDALIPDEAAITMADSTTHYPLSMVYIDPKGSKFEYRLSCVMPLSQWEKMYASPTPFTLTFTMKEPNDTRSYSFKCKDKKWESTRNKMQQIIFTIKLNTRQ